MAGTPAGGSVRAAGTSQTATARTSELSAAAHPDTTTSIRGVPTTQNPASGPGSRGMDGRGRLQTRASNETGAEIEAEAASAPTTRPAGAGAGAGAYGSESYPRHHRS